MSKRDPEYGEQRFVRLQRSLPVAPSPRSNSSPRRGGRDVTIICQVPTREYKAYAGACNHLVATHQIERL